MQAFNTTLEKTRVLPHFFTTEAKQRDLVPVLYGGRSTMNNHVAHTNAKLRCYFIMPCRRLVLLLLLLRRSVYGKLVTCITVK